MGGVLPQAPGALGLVDLVDQHGQLVVAGQRVDQLAGGRLDDAPAGLMERRVELSGDLVQLGEHDTGTSDADFPEPRGRREPLPAVAAE